MLQQARDLREEGDELHALLRTLSGADFDRPTPFKDWTINQVIEHLHWADRLAVLSLEDEAGFVAMSKGGNAAEAFGSGARGHELLEQWRDYFLQMCDGLGNSAPDRRLKWFGPDMSVRMFTTARQMETWAHGQDVYDLLKVQRTHGDRLKNIAHIGVSTYGWTFANRKLEPPGPRPQVELTAPSGATWNWGDADPANRVQGSAVEFCHVVTQGRNIADTDLTVTGEPARRWMEIAQCFAGPPEDPPAAGARRDH